MSSSSLSSKICFNPECAEFKPERPRFGWRLRTGEFAELCDRCASVFEEGKFCETYHLKASGWRCCESCGKRVHCGCIVSAYSFTLLDAGGIECLACARKNVVLGPNFSRPPSFFFQPPIVEKLKDLSTKNWSQSAGSVHVACWQSQNIFNEVGLSTSRDKASATSLEKRKNNDFPEKLLNGGHKHHTQAVLENDKAGINSDEQQPGSCLYAYRFPNSLEENAFSPHFTFPMPHVASNESNGQIGHCATHVRKRSESLSENHFQCDLNNGADSQGENKIQNARPQVDSRGKSQVLPRFWPRFTDQILQNMSMNSKSVITPLFEKMLSASDAGRIGRLVLPKKCAEAYLPTISQPEGLPLEVQDSTGKEWVFQFRFWPNNNSRMYVLEGVTPCIQNMQLQAGDIVTFSRLDPEGKLVMGFRKALVPPSSEQENETAKACTGICTKFDVELVDTKLLSKVDKSGYIVNEALGTKSSRKRKSSTLGSKSKRLRFENEDLIELKITWEEAQDLLQPPHNNPTIVVIEGFEIEEYEDAPILGKPAVFATDDMGSSCSAAQEMTIEQFESTLLPPNLASSSTLKAAKGETVDMEAIEGLDKLAKLAIVGEGGEGLSVSFQAATRHSRHGPGCTCFVCIQPPNGKGQKHEQTCTCDVCETLKGHFHTMMLRREKKQSEKEESMCKKQQSQSSDEDPKQCNDKTGSKSLNQKPDGDNNKVKSSTSPFKGQIDLNIQPERDEESPPGSQSSTMRRLMQDDGTERFPELQRLSSSCRHSDSVINQKNSEVEGKLGNDIVGGDGDNWALLSSKQSASTRATG